MEEISFEDYLAGARNFHAFFGVKPQDHILLLPTFDFLENDPPTVQALIQAGEEIGARVSVAVIEPCSMHGNPPRPIARAIESSDVFLAMGDKNPNPISGHCLTALRARWDYGAKQSDLHGGKGILATECSIFPCEIILAVGRSLMSKLKKGQRLEIVDDRGTHLVVPYKTSDIYGEVLALENGHLMPGQRSTWPLGNITILPGESLSGVAMADCISGVPKILENPARLAIDHCRITEIEDREETSRVRTELAKPENSNFVDKIMVSLNPKASITRGIHRSRFGELSQAAGVAKIGIGDRPGYVSSLFYTAVFLLRPTVILDGEVLFDHGRPSAFDDPEVRKIASKYGDPDELLSKIP